jgi:predicted nucleic acid-binding protein
VTLLVIDASVLVPAAVAFPDSHPSRLLDAVCAGEVEMIVCDRLLNEVERALTSKYFGPRINESERAEYLQLLGALGCTTRLTPGQGQERVPVRSGDQARRRHPRTIQALTTLSP